jgi:hypothetical protein
MNHLYQAINYNLINKINNNKTDKDNILCLRAQQIFA